MILYELWTEISPFIHIKSANLVLEAAKNGQLPLIPSYVNENWEKMIEKCLCMNSISRPNFDEIISELETDKYYTDDMDIESINEYKKVFSDSKNFMPNYSKDSSEISHEKSQNKENLVLIKLREGANAGYFASQFILAVALFDGIFGHPDYEESFKYSMMYIKNNEKSDFYKQMMHFYAAKSSVYLENYDFTEKLLKKSAAYGCGESAYLLAELMSENKVKCKFPNENEYYRIAANKCIPEAMKKWAYILYEKDLTKRDAIKFLEKGSDIGDPELIYLWSIQNVHGLNIPKDTKKAMKLMKLAANLGYPPALVDYGIHLLNENKR